MSFLFREFKLKIDFGASSRLSPEEIETYNRAIEEFKLLIRGFEGRELVQKAYEVMDELLAEGLGSYPVVCGPGCFYCCNQMVCCTQLEMDLIVDFLHSSNSRQKRLVRSEAKKRSQKYLAAAQAAGLIRVATRWEQIAGDLKKMMLHRPCPFLDHKKCGIYPVRPPDCRSARVLEKRCGPGLRKPPNDIKFFLDQVVADILTKEDEIFRKGEPKVSPLFGWIVSEEFGKYFG